MTAVLPLLKDLDPMIRASAAHSLNDLEDVRIGSHVIPLLEDPSPNVRGRAIYTLGRCHCKNVLNHIISFLDDANPDLRGEAINSLSALNNPRAIKPIKALLVKYPGYKNVLQQLEKQLASESVN